MCTSSLSPGPNSQAQSVKGTLTEQQTCWYHDRLTVRDVTEGIPLGVRGGGRLPALATKVPANSGSRPDTKEIYHSPHCAFPHLNVSAHAGPFDWDIPSFLCLEILRAPQVLVWASLSQTHATIKCFYVLLESGDGLGGSKALRSGEGSKGQNSPRHGEQ